MHTAGESAATMYILPARSKAAAVPAPLPRSDGAHKSRIPTRDSRFLRREFWRPIANDTRLSRAGMAKLDEERREEGTVILPGWQCPPRILALGTNRIHDSPLWVFLLLFGPIRVEGGPSAPLQRSRPFHVESGGRRGGCDANDCEP